MREKMLTDSASQISLLVIILLLIHFSPFCFSSVKNADAAAPTAITPHKDPVACAQ